MGLGFRVEGSWAIILPTFGVQVYNYCPSTPQHSRNAANLLPVRWSSKGIVPNGSVSLPETARVRVTVESKPQRAYWVAPAIPFLRPSITWESNPRLNAIKQGLSVCLFGVSLLFGITWLAPKHIYDFTSFHRRGTGPYGKPLNPKYILYTYLHGLFGVAFAIQSFGLTTLCMSLDSPQILIWAPQKCKSQTLDPEL